MIFETHILKSPLKNHIESIFHFKGFMPDYSIERVVPTGHLFILFELDGIARHTYNNKTLKPNGSFSKVWISGIHKNYLSISAPQDSEMFVIQFKPTGAYPFIHQPIDTLNNLVIDAQKILGNEILEIHDRILMAGSSKRKFKIIEEWLSKRYCEKKCANTELLDVLNKLSKEPITKYQNAISAYSKTQKHLIVQFKKYFGLTPKSFQRIFRFNEILAQIQGKEQINWSQITYNCGYTDQSHFIKEFKEFSGFNPQEFIAKDFNKDEPNFFPLDK